MTSESDKTFLGDLDCLSQMFGKAHTVTRTDASHVLHIMSYGKIMHDVVKQSLDSCS